MLKIVKVSKVLGQQRVLNDISLDIHKNEFVCLLGPSGCGKTTLLRIIAGLETADHGQIYLGDKDLLALSPQQRPVNIVFQKYALFPHLSVFDNVAFGLKMKKIPTEEVAQRCDRFLKMVSLESLADRRPETLSGGQAQRVALVRALVNEPQVLLLDEPLSALDKKMRLHMQVELRSLQQKLQSSFLFVTHDQEEAVALADRIVVMNQGQIEQIGTPDQILKHPQTKFVEEFISHRSGGGRGPGQV